MTLAGAINSPQPSDKFTVDAGTLPPSSYPTSDLNIGGLDVKAHSSFAVVNGVTISPGAPGVTIDGTIASLEIGAATLDVGTTERFAISTEVAHASVNLVTFTGGQTRHAEAPLTLLWLSSLSQRFIVSGMLFDGVLIGPSVYFIR